VLFMSVKTTQLDGSRRWGAAGRHDAGCRKEELMEVQDVIAQARDVLTVKRVFGEPYEKDGVTVIPVARVQGGAGGGGGEGPDRQGKGSGSGFGLSARPVGAFMIRGDQLTWRPVVDVNRIVLGCQVVAVVALLTIRRSSKRGPRREPRSH
jgi:uncharacterized spore protein YtfJ